MFAFVLLVAAVGVGWHLFTRSPDAGNVSAACASRTIRAGETLSARFVTVDVYNGGDEEGMAGRVSSALQARGFRPGTIANNLSAIKPKAVTILTARRTDPRVQLVAQQFTQVDYRKPDVATSRAVTVLVGDGFSDLKADAPTSIKATSDVTVCASP